MPEPHVEMMMQALEKEGYVCISQAEYDALQKPKEPDLEGENREFIHSNCHIISRSVRVSEEREYFLPPGLSQKAYIIKDAMWHLSHQLRDSLDDLFGKFATCQIENDYNDRTKIYNFAFALAPVDMWSRKSYRLGSLCRFEYL